ncbi:MAG: short chain dehydrogenase, partial [Actinomycetes bacterium]
ASGLLGSHVCEALSGSAEVIPASRSGSTHSVDITDPASILELLQEVGPVDAIICTAGMVRFVPLADSSGDDWLHGLANKLMGQVNVVRIGREHVTDGGSIILTTGVLAQYPMPGSAIVTTVNAAVEGFVSAAALEIERGVRVNAVSPGWVSESMIEMGMDPAPGLPAAQVAEAYVDLLNSASNGKVVPAAKGI